MSNSEQHTNTSLNIPNNNNKSKYKATNSISMSLDSAIIDHNQVIQRNQIEISTKSRGYGAQNGGGHVIGGTRINSTPIFHEAVQV